MLVEQMHKAGKVGATGSGYSPARSGAVVDSNAASTPGTGELAEVLTNFAHAVTGSAVASLDGDRLGLFARAMSADNEELPVHLANRLFVRRESIQLLHLEKFIWFDAFVSDLGRCKFASERVFPFAAILKGREELEELALGNVVRQMQSKKEFVRSGWLRFATAYLLRPPELWPKGTATASELGSALARWESAFEGSSSRHAACYWLTVARPRDRKLALALGNAQTEVASQYGVAFAQILASRPSADLLAKLNSELLLEEVVCRRFPNRDVYETITVETLTSIVQRSQNPTEVRVHALRLLLKRADVTSEMLQPILKEIMANYEYPIYSRDWELAAQSEILDSGHSVSIFEKITKAIDRIEASHGIKTTMNNRLRASNPSLVEILSEATHISEDMDTVDPFQVAIVLAGKNGTTELVGIARKLASGTFGPANRYLDSARLNNWGRNCANYSNPILIMCRRALF